MPRAERLPLTLQVLPLATEQRLLLAHNPVGVAGAVQCRDVAPTVLTIQRAFRHVSCRIPKSSTSTDP
jgi:hypothetical protein